MPTKLNNDSTIMTTQRRHILSGSRPVDLADIWNHSVSDVDKCGLSWKDLCDFFGDGAVEAVYKKYALTLHRLLVGIEGRVGRGRLNSEDLLNIAEFHHVTKWLNTYVYDK